MNVRGGMLYEPCTQKSRPSEGAGQEGTPKCAPVRARKSEAREPTRGTEPRPRDFFPATAASSKLMVVGVKINNQLATDHLRAVYEIDPQDVDAKRMLSRF